MMSKFLTTRFEIDNEALASTQDELPFWSSAFGHLLLDTIPIKKGMTALDIGFGTGFPAIEIADRLGEDSRIYGVDVWVAGLGRALQKISVRSVKNLYLMLGKAENLPFPDESFDLIVSNNGLNNVQDLQKSLSECHRTTKQNGHLVFTVNLPETMEEFYEVFESVLKDYSLENEIQKMKDHIFDKRKPLDFLQKSVEQAGFQIEKKIEDSFSYRFVNGTAMFAYFLIREFFLPSWKSILPEKHVIPIFAKIEERLNILSEEKGELKLTIPFVCFDFVKQSKSADITLI